MTKWLARLAFCCHGTYSQSPGVPGHVPCRNSSKIRFPFPLPAVALEWTISLLLHCQSSSLLLEGCRDGVLSPLVSPFVLVAFPLVELVPGIRSSGLERVLPFAKAGEGWVVLEEGLTTSVAQVREARSEHQEAAGLLPGDNNGKASFPSGPAPHSGELHSPPQGF